MQLTQPLPTISIQEQMLELTRQVQELARQLIGKQALDNSSAMRPEPVPTPESLQLPDAVTIRRTIRTLQVRASYFQQGLFADPAWSMLLDLAAAHRENKQVSITSLCIASGVPATTALRWINLMVDGGLMQRCDDPSDRRRAFIKLTDRAIEALARYFHEAR